MIDREGVSDVVGVVLTVALILYGIGFWLRAAYRSQEAEALAKVIARRRRARHVLRHSPVARTASRK